MIFKNTCNTMLKKVGMYRSPLKKRLHTKKERRNALRSRFYSAYSVPVTTTLVTPGVTVTAPVAASWA